jgi:hypothetical protein
MTGRDLTPIEAMYAVQEYTHDGSGVIVAHAPLSMGLDGTVVRRALAHLQARHPPLRCTVQFPPTAGAAPVFVAAAEVRFCSPSLPDHGGSYRRRPVLLAWSPGLARRRSRCRKCR